MSNRRSVRTTASSDLIYISTSRGCLGGAPAPPREPANRWQQEPTHQQRDQTDRELHHDRRLPALPALEQPARNRGSSCLLRILAGGISPGGHGDPTARRASHTTVGEWLANRSAALLELVVVDWIPNPIGCERPAVVRDRVQGNDRAEVGDRGRSGRLLCVGIDIGGEEETEPKGAEQEHECSHIRSDGS